LSECPPKIVELVERFQLHLEQYKSGNYNEAQVRIEFIDPMFKALGWDVDNEQGYAEAYKDVIHEDAIKIGSATKAPDYCFRIGGRRKFFLEAKKPSVDIKEGIEPAYQIRRYAWSSKLSLSILTDFEEFAVYDCRIKPDKNDKASTARVLYIKYTEYLERWNEIAGIFSKEAVLKGSFDKYSETTKKKKGTAEVDDAFLKEIEGWRDVLAKNIATRNENLSQRDLNYTVQTTIDRIIFLRICEDRGVEHYARLMAVTNGDGVYQRLLHLFYDADDRYNSGLFHFKPEKGRLEEPDELSAQLKIDDKILRDIILSLYYPDSPYEFSALPADILGQVYEQFLGKIIRLTPGHRAVVEDKPEVKKAGGVFYTPTYIVDYIVQNTVGKLLEGKTPKQADNLTICDPACGSGSFLIGAYQYLLDWRRDYYIENGAEKFRKELYQSQSGEWRLTIQERKRILLNNIYGVDIDSQAVETTKLSLLLKVLEQATEETINQNLKLFRERALPDLANNIKCGNSLIGPDFYNGQQLGLLDDEERHRINVFDWKTEFPAIMKSGGFDAVIGNPPYVRQEALGEFKNYFQQRYAVYHGMADLYAYFIEKGVTLIKPEGFFSYIVANKWMRANYGEPLRQWLKARPIEEIVDFGDLPVFQGATTYPCIIRVTKNGHGGKFNVAQVKTLEFDDNLCAYVKQNGYKVNRKKLDDGGWSLTNETAQTLLNKLKETGVPLGEYVKGEIYRGVLTGLNEAFVIDAETRKRLIAEDSKSKELIKPFLVGKDIKRYAKLDSERYLVMIPKGWTREKSSGAKNAWGWFMKNYPAIASHLEPFAKKAAKRCDKGEYWWELRACDYYKEFEKPKLLLPDISLRGNFAYDAKSFFCVNTAYVIPVDDKYLLGVLNSTLITFCYRNITSTIRGGYLRFIYQYLVTLPIRAINIDKKSEKSAHDKMVSFVETMLILNKKLAGANTDHDKKVLQRQIGATDNQIDQLVYELYGLTEEEINIVEGAT
jgi:type I restriction-modification system DNA methylase subunit